MENRVGIFVLIVAGAVINLAIGFVVLRALASLAGVPKSVNTSSRALESLLTIVPVAGVAGLPFFLLPFIGPLLGIFVSGCVAPGMLAGKYSVEVGTAAKIILPTVAVIYAVSAVILYYGIPML